MSAVRLRLVVRELDGHPAPAMVRRKGNRTLVAWDACSTRLDIVDWLVCNLPREEQDLLVAGLGLTWPLPSWTTRKLPASLYVPPALRLPGDMALQGGRELDRRTSAGTAGLDWAAWNAERLGLPIDMQTLDDLLAA